MLASFLSDISDGNNIAPKRLADRLRVPMTQLSRLAHVNRNTMADRPNSVIVQKQLGAIAKIIARAAAMTDNEGAAIIWFKHQPIAGFGGKTAEELVEAGHADAVMWHLESIEQGGVA
jgi:hypothetical protein